MNKVKYALRVVYLIFLLMLAAFGIGLTGNFLNNNRERFMDNEIRREYKMKTEDDEEEVKNE